ncbi:hypothetical protein ABT324_02955 [Saccharopolyspora sp. NPDC000359]|uniref:hypothetical protein n=1 Tax=Saccharopolyspora sp. NPDC000359 TaxID=3154251 RepID=UPI00332C4711
MGFMEWAGDGASDVGGAVAKTVGNAVAEGAGEVYDFGTLGRRRLSKLAEERTALCGLGAAESSVTRALTSAARL